jgi:hypothetical protein
VFSFHVILLHFVFFLTKILISQSKMTNNNIELEYGIIIVFVVAILAIWAAKSASNSKERMTAGLGTINGLAWMNSGPGKMHRWGAPGDSCCAGFNGSGEDMGETDGYYGNSSGVAANSMLMGIGA